jgi:hypothetical protein
MYIATKTLTLEPEYALIGRIHRQPEHALPVHFEMSYFRQLHKKCLLLRCNCIKNPLKNPTKKVITVTHPSV